MSAPTFTSIPAEIRRIIYRHALKDLLVIEIHKRSSGTTSTTIKAHFSRALLLTCKLVHGEVLDTIHDGLTLWITEVPGKWLREDSPLSLRQYFLKIKRVQAIQFNDGEMAFDLFPSLESFNFCVFSMVRSIGSLIKFPPVTEEKEAEEYINGSMDEVLKVQAKNVCLLQVKTISEAFAEPGRKYGLEHNFYVNEDAPWSGDWRRRSVSQESSHLSHLTDVKYSRWRTIWTPWKLFRRTFIDEDAGIIKDWNDGLVSTYPYQLTGCGRDGGPILETERWNCG